MASLIVPGLFKLDVSARRHLAFCRIRATGRVIRKLTHFLNFFILRLPPGKSDISDVFIHFVSLLIIELQSTILGTTYKNKRGRFLSSEFRVCYRRRTKWRHSRERGAVWSTRVKQLTRVQNGVGLSELCSRMTGARVLKTKCMPTPCG